MTPNKDFKYWTFEELVDVYAWRFVQGLLRGENLRSLLCEAMLAVTNWQDQRVRKKNK